DGGMPANDGRGYVIRRILRRAARFGRMLNMHEPFIYKIVDTVCEILGDVYPESVERRDHVKKVIKYEEQSFGETLDKGLEVYQRIKETLLNQKKTEISGEDVFKLYDTYGFPVDLTQLMAEDDGFMVDIAGFNQEMAKQKKRARSARNFKMNAGDLDKEWIVLSEGDDSEFVGYDQTAVRSILRKYSAHGEQYHLVLDKTPFYAESGGEIGDTGTISNADFIIDVTDTLKINNMIVHIGNLVSGKIGNTIEVDAAINVERSDAIRANHTATHLLQAALREVLGDHVHQSGSLVTAERLRFDLTHYTKITQQEIEAIEDIVNRKIRENIEVAVKIQDYNEAKKSGAMALFGEKYEDIVRVIGVGEFSKELCGGKHVKRTGDIGGFKIISESSVAAGIRRIEAITGQSAYELDRLNGKLITDLTILLNTTKENLLQKADELISRVKNLEKELKSETEKGLVEELDTLISNSTMISGVTIFTHQYQSQSMDELKNIADLFRDKLELGIALIISVNEGKLLVVVTATDAVLKKYQLHAGTIVKELAPVLGGGGGGRPHLATAGGKNIDKISDIIKTFKEIVEEGLTH
ncbi:MAG: alanine--tRNA ligase, partial [Candidatus Marinimicrobia bacterium]|nr:alanine--tRNA ligase [Candidatus Neomarinimicrobiota bacterium]